MASFSKVILMGNVTRDPEIRFGSSGTAIASFSVGINRKYKIADGSLKEETCFVDITFFGKQAETCQKYVHKGDSIVIDGRLHQDSWEGKDGQKRNKIGVIGERLHLMPKRTGKIAEADSEEETSGDIQDDVKSSASKKENEVPF
ncbi:MAG: hypothetical protein A2539_04200 [Elusimicrobia bacterium RIFOXYD2_FULL_34_15]|nr:MAG: hypothetical protein A2539_04200 [Elusimicrobia bacterium RIFOXYD2_FULL_34_15]